MDVQDQPVQPDRRAPEALQEQLASLAHVVQVKSEHREEMVKGVSLEPLDRLEGGEELAQLDHLAPVDHKVCKPSKEFGIANEILI